jgi:hypothetical protein
MDAGMALLLAAGVFIIILALVIRANRVNTEDLAVPPSILDSGSYAAAPTKLSEVSVDYSYSKAGIHPWCELPDFSGERDTRLSVRSMSETGVFYEVDLLAYTCTCPDWSKLRGEFPVRNFRRACKHIVALLLFRDNGEKLSDLLYAFLSELPGGVPTNCNWIAAQLEGYDVLFVARGGNPWLDIVTVAPKPRKKRPYQRFGFNLAEGRWSYGRRPRNALMIRKIIHDLPMIAEHYRPTSLYRT